MPQWLSVDVGSVKVPVSLRARTTEEVADGTVGSFDKFLCTIWLAEGMPHDVTRSTLLHELGHAIAWIYGLPCGDDEEEEAHVRLLSGIVFDVLSRNEMLRLPELPEAS